MWNETEVLAAFLLLLCLYSVYITVTLSCISINTLDPTLFWEMLILYFSLFSSPPLQWSSSCGSTHRYRFMGKMSISSQTTYFSVCAEPNTIKGFIRVSTLLFVLATDKVALLIGNLNYSNHPSLMAPIMDVHELSNLLQQLGFRVVSLLDLTREEMLAAIEKFIQLLDTGVYGECTFCHSFFFLWGRSLTVFNNNFFFSKDSFPILHLN